MTKTERKAIAEALKRARPIIKNGSTRYICYAVDRVSENRVSKLSAHYVIGQLNGFATLEGWVAAHAMGISDSYTQLYSSRALFNEWSDLTRQCFDNTAKMRETRLAWIDHMIATLEK